MRIAVCDDSGEERAHLVLLLREYFAQKNMPAEVAEYDSGEALSAAFVSGMASLVFLDIYMDGMTGVETARRLKAAEPDCVLIFTTSSREHGADAFDVDAFYYMVKPVGRDKLFSVLDKWYDTLSAARTVEFKCGRTLRQIAVKDILYIDVIGRNSTVHMAEEEVETSMSLAAVERQLPKEQFCRPIRYCLAAFAHICSIRDDGVLLDNGMILPVSRLERDHLRQQLAGYRLRMLRRR